ncbi:pilus assembly protein [Lysobacter sp. CA199]|uniref:pilus assembly protein n=1 Tax=Lysobacter sp. CA199 TaxID=3455608 RepID=UPI003F8D25FF
MRVNRSHPYGPVAMAKRLQAVLIGLIAALSATPSMSVEIQNRPLALGNDVPNNMVLIPSVEFPTIISQANFDLINGQDTYNPSRSYVGYFDSEKCYEYVFDAQERLRHFKPVSAASSRTCLGASKQWSGNFLNWAATQTIDPFRKALTGGYRVKDTPQETWLEKAVNEDHGIGTRFFDNKLLSKGQTGLMPISEAFPVRMRAYKLRAQIFFTNDSTLDKKTGNDRVEAAQLATAVPYNPGVHGSLTGKTSKGAVDPTVYSVSIRVAVCVESGKVKPEANCIKYAKGWKPEGLLQKYNDKLRFSIFGYLNDSSVGRDGGVLRARQKYIGPFSYDPIKGQQPNAAKEWDPGTGVQDANPDSADASGTNTRVGGNHVTNSGVINYLNKFGQTTGTDTSNNAKGLDNVSELYYAATRYFKNQDNVPEYTDITTANAELQTDRFPVITDWVNPIQYRCQRNVAVGIGDAYTHRDRNLPGSTVRNGEPAMPAKVTADTSVNVETELNRVFQLEGLNKNAKTIPFNPEGSLNSAFIAGLAYAAHTQDLQPDMPDKQTLSTYWVDVLPDKIVVPSARNQYYLAAKYGGFDVPEGFDPNTRTEQLTDAWWTDGDLIGLADAANEKRPRNFFVAYQAEQMIQGLTKAFEASLRGRRGAASAVGLNGASAQEGAVIYAPTYFTDWRGELAAKRLDPITRTFVPVWIAGEKVPVPAERKVYANSGGYKEFTWSALDPGDRSSLSSVAFADTTGKVLATGADVLNYLRGERSKEIAKGGPLRDRSGVLGDFVNSTPLYVGKPNAGHYANATFNGGGEAYRKFAADSANRKAVVYVGGNDGMLHGFDAETGAETYAFIPQAVLKRTGMDGLAGYASPNYVHRFFVDGELTVADVYIQGAWKTVLIGTLGRGGRGVFALDITNPEDVKFMWELSDSQIPALGNNLGKPWISQTANGTWTVLLGNGPNSDGGKAQLVTLDVATGAVTAIDTGVAGDNGLSAARAWDSNNDGFVDTAYAGDMKGNLWKFSGFGGSVSATKLFEATGDGKAQPITATPLVGRKPDSLETWVFFGTGAFLGSADLGDKSKQSWYGITDLGTLVTRGELTARVIEFEGPMIQQDKSEVDVRVISAAKDGDMVGKKGWYLDLVSPGPTLRGERMVVPNLFDGNRLLGISRIPDVSDPCSPGGEGFIMEIDPFTGGRANGHVFDANGDGKIDSNDGVVIGGGGDPGTPISGIGTKGGAPNGGVIIPGNNGNVIPIQNDSGGLEHPKSAPAGLGAKRVAWREIRRD